MPTWQPDQYLRFEEERTRPCRDLVAAIRLESPRDVIDLGCGPGNSSAVLAERWPAARITGLDSSVDMLKRARERHPGHDLRHCDIADWLAGTQDAYDLVFSNATLQWVPNHAEVYPRLLARVAPGGVLAIQVPSNMHDHAHRIMRELASSPAWRERFPEGGVREWFVHDAGFYYDVLVPVARQQNIWETTYIHILPNVDAIAEWYRSTGLRPFLDCLTTDAEREDFVRDSKNALSSDYRPRSDGRVLFPFRRLFLIASR